MNDSMYNFYGTPNTNPENQFFPAQLTASLLGNSTLGINGQYTYSFVEQNLSANGALVPTDSPRTGNCSFSPYAVELNNNLVNTPCYVFLRIRGVINGNPFYEFAGPASSITFVGLFGQYNSGFLSVPSSTTTTLTITGTTPGGWQDGCGLHSGSVTVGTTGIYHIDASAQWSWSSGAFMSSLATIGAINIAVNGVSNENLVDSTPLTDSTMPFGSPATGPFIGACHTVTGDVHLNAGDTITFVGWQNSGATIFCYPWIDVALRPGST